MMTGWELLMSAAVDPADIEQVCVRVNFEAGEVPVVEAEFWLSLMRWFTSHEDEGWIGHPTATPDEVYDFQVWTPDRIYRTREHEGIMVLISWPRHPEQWMYITSRFEPALTEILTSSVWKYGKRT
jgi:hypothetical protein